MQRSEDGGIVISCDFCGTDWDEVLPMIEGHQGSILCLECLKRATDEITPTDESINCTLCLMEKEPDTPVWQPTERPETANSNAAICYSCMKQAMGTFSKDPDVDYKTPR